MAASCAVSSAGDAATSSWKRGTRSKSTSRHPWKGWRYGVSCGPASATIDASAVSWAIVDIANFYVSAGRLFDPALRSEEHTSELQSLMRISYAVFCLKKKNKDRLR